MSDEDAWLLIFMSLVSLTAHPGAPSAPDLELLARRADDALYIFRGRYPCPVQVP